MQKNTGTAITKNRLPVKICVPIARELNARIVVKVRREPKYAGVKKLAKRLPRMMKANNSVPDRTLTPKRGSAISTRNMSDSAVIAAVRIRRMSLLERMNTKPQRLRITWSIRVRS
jgi:hypothetical protein